MLVRLFNSIFDIPKRKLYNCSVIGCMASTTDGNDPDPRKRWMLGREIGDEEEKEIVNLCPAHVKEFFGLNETDYKALELGEGVASNKITTQEWQRGVSALR